MKQSTKAEESEMEQLKQIKAKFDLIMKQESNSIESPNSKTGPMPTSKEQNFILIFGHPTRPSGTGQHGTRHERRSHSEMTQVIAQAMVQKYDRTTMRLTLPNLIDRLNDNSVNFETVKGDQLQKLEMFYAHNVATRSIGVIFVTNPKPYNDQAKKGLKALNLLQTELKFSKVNLYLSLGKG